MGHSLPSYLERPAYLYKLNKARYDSDALGWRRLARDKQIPPSGDWFVWLIRSGRGFGKTWTGANWVIERAMIYPQYPIALIGQTVADVRDTMIELGDSCILKQAPDWFMPKYEPSKRRLTFPNGAVAITYSCDKPDQLRGPQHGTAWVDELAKSKYPQETWDQMEMGLRLGPDPKVIVTTTPRPVPIIKQLLADQSVASVVGSTFENAANLSERFLERIRLKYEGTRLGRQELHGDVLDDVIGALWTNKLIEDNRIRENQLPDLYRIVVAIDPAASTNEESSETGIVVAGIANILGVVHGYVLEDVTIKGSPHDWATTAIKAYYKWKADRIIGEANNGGDMVENTIRTVDRNVSFKKVWASRSKQTRAEPVASFDEQGLIHHVGSFPELEDQMCTWVPGEKSPDRMDARVWALTELMVGKQRRGKKA